METCGLYVVNTNPALTNGFRPQASRRYLPQISLSAQATILSSVSRTILTQTFVNDSSDPLPQVRYVFPLFDGVSVVGFTCTINDERIIHGTVKEKQEAKKTYDDAVAQGQTAGLLEQSFSASDVFSTSLGNIPASAKIKVDITYLGELKHDAEIDGIRYTIPTMIAPRYGSNPKVTETAATVQGGKSISVGINIEMQPGSIIKTLQSPSHPISVAMGESAQLASVSLTLGSASLEKDFILQLAATNTDSPCALLEAHPAIPGQRALMTTLVPKFTLPQEYPEIVFVCDRSGSMRGQKMANLKSALQVFLKSLPLGVTFNICSFGNSHSFLFPRESLAYDKQSLDSAMALVQNMGADMGGTEMYEPIKQTLKMRQDDANLEVFVLTDGQIRNSKELIDLVTSEVEQSKGAIRIFSLGIGHGTSTALIEGLARMGNGFSQSVGENEKLDSKVVRMLKASLTPHVTDYSLEVKYRQEKTTSTTDMVDDFELIDRVADLQVDVSPADQPIKDEAPQPPATTEPISLFDPAADVDAKIQNMLASATTDRAANIPVVSAPRILQTPFEIPPLFPFSRTNIYLLLSPETTENVPETVILRGTSKHGPLELRIPVTTPTTPTGETIHQLAARKAVRELADGKGWIFHAKEKISDANDNPPHFKFQHRGLFPTMVAREAVRLGVQFQIAGRWTSFVAVDDNGGETTGTDPVSVPPLVLHDENLSVRHRSMGSRGRAAPPPVRLRHVAMDVGLSSSAVQSLEVEHVSDTVGNRGSSRAKARNLGAQAFSLAQSLLLSSWRPRASLKPQVKKKCAPSSSTVERNELDLSQDASPKISLELLVELQDFSGFWAWDDRVLDAIGRQAAGQDSKVWKQAEDKFGATAVAATVVVLAYLRKILLADMGAWELMADKARGWLEQQPAFGGAKDKVEEAVLAIEASLAK